MDITTNITQQSLTEKRRERIGLAALVILGAILRLIDLGAITHNLDQSFPIYQALLILKTGQLPIIGQPSAALFGYHLPLLSYIFVPIIALTHSTIAVYGFVILVNSLGTWVCYRLAKLLFSSSRPAFIAAWLFAISPWVIDYSRMTWPPAFMALLMLLTAWALFPIFTGQIQDKRRFLMGLGCVVILAGCNQLGYLLAAPLAILFIIFWRRVEWRIVLPVSASGILILLVFFSQLPDARTNLVQAGSHYTQAEFRLVALSHALRLVTGQNYTIAHSAELEGLETWENAGQIIHYAILSLMLGGGIFALSRFKAAIPSQQRDLAIVLLVWFFTPVAMMTYTSSLIHPYYLLLTLPAGFLLAAWGAEQFLRYRPARIGLVLLLIAYTMTTIINTQRVRQPGSHNSLSEMILEDALDLGEAVNQLLPPGGTVLMSTSEYILPSITQDLPLQIPETRSPKVTILPAKGGLYVTTTTPDQSFKPPFFEPVYTQTLAGGKLAAIFRYLPGQLDLSTLPGQLNRQTRENLTLSTYELRQNRAGTWILTTYWQVEAVDHELNSSNFGMFVHVYDSANERTQIINGESVPGYHWFEGDIHIHQQRFELPEDMTFTLRIGQYDPYAQQSLLFINPDGSLTNSVSIQGKDIRGQKQIGVYSQGSWTEQRAGSVPAHLTN